MLVGVLGVNHKSSCLTLREKLAAVRSSLSLPFPAAILSTCNRFEIYYSADVLADAHVELVNNLRCEIDLAFEHHLYSYFGLDCFSHLVSVTAGLDSALVGETEIQSQVKRMYATYKKTLNTPLHYLIQKSLKMAKGIRNAGYYPQTGSSLGKCIGDKLITNRVLCIGNSAINRRVWSYLRRLGVEVHVASRSFVPDMQQVPLERWPEYTAIVAATNSDSYLIDKVPDDKQRQFFDLSIPRVIDPGLGRCPGVSLYNIDELTKTEPPRPLEDCKEIIERLANRQMALYQKNRATIWTNTAHSQVNGERR